MEQRSFLSESPRKQNPQLVFMDETQPCSGKGQKKKKKKKETLISNFRCSEMPATNDMRASLARCLALAPGALSIILRGPTAPSV